MWHAGSGALRMACRHAAANDGSQMRTLSMQSVPLCQLPTLVILRAASIIFSALASDRPFTAYSFYLGFQACVAGAEQWVAAWNALVAHAETCMERHAGGGGASRPPKPCKLACQAPACHAARAAQAARCPIGSMQLHPPTRAGACKRRSSSQMLALRGNMMRDSQV
jgi:hypothetical protein